MRTMWMVLAGLIPGVAWAQGYEVRRQAPAQEVAVDLNGGLGEFTGKVADRTSIGPAYGLNLSTSVAPEAQLEAGYSGFTSAIDGGGRISSNRLQLGARAGPQLAFPIPWQPYVSAAVAANFIGVNTNSQGLNSGVEGEIPLGVGADFLTTSPFRVGVRGTYAWNPGVGGAISNEDQHPDDWQAALVAKGAF